MRHYGQNVGLPTVDLRRSDDKARNPPDTAHRHPNPRTVPTLSSPAPTWQSVEGVIVAREDDLKIPRSELSPKTFRHAKYGLTSIRGNNETAVGLQLGWEWRAVPTMPVHLNAAPQPALCLLAQVTTDLPPGAVGASGWCLDVAVCVLPA